MVSFNSRPERFIGRSTSESESSSEAEGSSLEIGSVAPKPVSLAKETKFIKKIRQFVKGIFKEVGEFFQKVVGNSNCARHYVAMRHSLARIRVLSVSIFKNMAAQLKKASQALSQNRIVRKLKDSFEYLQKCDFAFIRRSGEPYIKEKLDQVEELISVYHDFEKKEEKLEANEVLHQAILLLQRIGKLKFDPKRYAVRNAMVAEVLTKHVVAHPLPSSTELPIPCFDAKGHPVVVNYGIGQQLTLSTTDIPVYIFVPSLEAERALFSPLLIFRGTRFGFANEADIRSVIENLNRAGPARGVYDDFKKKLSSLFRKWYGEKNTSKPLFRVLGYSQGGVLGQRACVDFYPFIDKGILNPSIFFNSPGVENDYALAWEAIKPNEKPVVMSILVTRDVVSKRGTKFIGEVYDFDPLKKSGFLEAHMGAKFIASEVHVYLVDNDKEAESYTRQLINQVMSSDVVDSLYKFVVNGLNINGNIGCT